MGLRRTPGQGPLSARTAVVRAARHSPGMALQDVAAAAGTSTATLRDALTGLETRGGCGQAAARLVAAGGGVAVAGLAHRGCPPPVTRLAADPPTAGRYLDAAGVLALTGTARWAARLPAERASIAERRFLAGWSGCPPRLISTLAQDDDWGVRAAVAARVDCSAGVIAALVEDESEKVRVDAADRCPPHLIPVLAEDFWFEARSAVASRVDCPPNLILKLAQDDHWDVRVAGRSPGWLPCGCDRSTR